MSFHMRGTRFLSDKFHHMDADVEDGREMETRDGQQFRQETRQWVEHAVLRSISRQSAVNGVAEGIDRPMVPPAEPRGRSEFFVVF
ncbi:unnamed protein product [Heligmosomoides polygyrus]|uniref:Transposase n=1 Tax=Heligmosomoides polygyrus TaxID=6339 RepID=A0A183G3P1_HELPZ|nr:unnamed protein product [Heligmosomoides polygyrus]